MTAQKPPTERAPVRSLTRGQITVLATATLIMAAVGIAGAIGTYANANAVLHRSQTALGVVAAGEGATLVAALLMIGVTMLGQPAPHVARAALWVLPAAASLMGLAIAPTIREAVIYALTPLAMTAAAEGISFLARRIVAYRTDTDTEAQRRNAETMRRIAFHAAQAERHPDKKIRDKSALTAWKLMREIGEGDAQLGSGLITVQRDRLTEGADTALQAMLTGTREPGPAQPAPLAIETSEPTVETRVEPTGSTVILSQHTELATPAHAPALPDTRSIIQPSDQVISREPVLSPTEPAFAKTAQAAAESGVEPDGDDVDESAHGGDEKEQQIADLAQRLRNGEPLTKTTAAQLLGVSLATGGRRLKDARTRIGEGTGQYL
ncbi:conjugal transfer protein [Streptomyces pseudovenezuelae]|uniref:conjugal transfer protein n=1 Tax=Streptomyces pseudovenezuelae TaxID=67350 RepID=UPI0036EA0D6D